MNSYIRWSAFGRIVVVVESGRIMAISEASTRCHDTGDEVQREYAGGR